MIRRSCNHKIALTEIETLKSWRILRMIAIWARRCAIYADELALSYRRKAQQIFLRSTLMTAVVIIDWDVSGIFACSMIVEYNGFSGCT